MQIGNGRPNDERRFIHKKLLGSGLFGSLPQGISEGGLRGGLEAIKTFATGGPTASALSIGRTAARNVVSRFTTARPSVISELEKNEARYLKFPGFTGFAGGPCDFPKVIDKMGRCRLPTSGRLGGEQFGVGEAVMGRYGAALEPGSMIVDRAVCLKGMQLGNDGLCYNKSQITNKQRMWPRGRRPLLTGGDMRAISTAARAGARLDKASTRLRGMGMMRPLPKPRRKTPAGHKAKLTH